MRKKKVLKMNHQPLVPIQQVGRMSDIINIIITKKIIIFFNYYCHDIFLRLCSVDMTWVSVILLLIITMTEYLKAMYLNCG